MTPQGHPDERMLSSPPRSQPWSPVTKTGMSLRKPLCTFLWELCFSLAHSLSLPLVPPLCPVKLGIHSQCQAWKLLWKHTLFVKYSHKTHSSPTCEMSPGQPGWATCPAMVEPCASGSWVMPRLAWLTLTMRRVRRQTPRACLSCRSTEVCIEKST